MRRVAVVTGASGGMGEYFVKYLCLEENVDEVWAIARRVEILESLKEKYGDKVVVYPLDLIKQESLDDLKQRLDDPEIELAWFVNNAGMGRSIRFKDEVPDYMNRSIDLNVRAVTQLSYLALQKMKPGAHLLNVGSQAGNQPTPWETTYAASKAYVNSFTESLYYEYKELGIHVMLVCPYWTEDAMLREMDHGKKVKFDFLSMPEEVVSYAIKAAKKNKKRSVNKPGIKLMNFAQRIVPEKIQMKVWRKTAKQLIDLD